ncbi:hypothetical protein GOV13_02410 [Candidatus Pacearchaeota archaeon]|nr:hypothetical protein [Candidatus Pacearchaeota archaeon]
MKKIFTFLLIALLIFPMISAVLEIEKKSSNEVLVVGVGEPVTFDLNIKNVGFADSFEFYNFLGFNMFPVGTVPIGAGQTKNVKLQISPIADFPHRGFYTFTYFIKGFNENASEQSETLTFKAIELADAFEVGSGDVDSEAGSINIYIKNKVDIGFENMEAEFSSAFFDFKENFTLDANQRKEFNVELNKKDFKKLMAGFYTLDTKIKVKDQEANLEGTIKFAEKDIVTTSQKDYGFFINTRIIEKVNEGNVLAKSETVIKKNIVSRLFTTFSPEPDIVERDSSTVYYTWVREVNPSEILTITVRTNWLFPLVTVLLFIVIIILIKQYSGTDLVLRKRVSFVKTKGGEFALKVTIIANARRYVERVSIIDRLPPLVKVHERFGGQHPKRVDEKTRRIEWGFEKLEAGEMRTASYIIYSKVGIVGKFALPSAAGIYEKEGEIKEVTSNRAFFIAEQKVSKEEIY